MAVHPKHKHNISVVVLMGVILLFVLLIFSNFVTNDSKSSKTVANFEKKYVYTSKVNDFIIDLTEIDYETVEETYNFTSIVADEGQIHITINGTNFDNIQDYLSDLSQKNSFSLENSENIDIGNSPAIKGKIMPMFSSKSQMAYFIYPDKWIVYTLSTDSPELYDELDQIAESFKYTGE